MDCWWLVSDEGDEDDVGVLQRKGQGMENVIEKRRWRRFYQQALHLPHPRDGRHPKTRTRYDSCTALS